MSPQQLSMLRSQMGGMGGTPVLVQAPQTIFQTQSGQNIAIPLANLGQQGQLFLNPQTGTIQQSTGQIQAQQASVKEEQ